jgi:hypothetical protein
MTEIPSDLELQLRGRIAMLEEDRETLLGRNAVLLKDLQRAEEDRDKHRNKWGTAYARAIEAELHVDALKTALKESNKQRGIAGDTIHRLRGEAALLRESRVEALDSGVIVPMEYRENPKAEGGGIRKIGGEAPMMINITNQSDAQEAADALVRRQARRQAMEG